MENKKVAIIGNGWVGKAMQELFPESLVYVRNISNLKIGDDLLKDLGLNYDDLTPGEKETYMRAIKARRNITDDKNLINKCDVAFICVPTPNLMRIKKIQPESYENDNVGENKDIFEEGALDTSIVEECIAWCECPLIVIRSTVNPGDCDRWTNKYNKTILFQPEYLGETPQHPLLDTVKLRFIIIGGRSKGDRRTLINLYATVYNANITIRQVSLTEAEVIKLTENRAIAFKVAQCQELYDVCQKGGIDYYTIRDAVYGDDPRFNLWWTFVYPEKRGFKSKCIPKDIYAWSAWAESLGYEPTITRAILEKNKEWIG